MYGITDMPDNPLKFVSEAQFTPQAKVKLSLKHLGLLRFPSVIPLLSPGQVSLFNHFPSLLEQPKSSGIVHHLGAFWIEQDPGLIQTRLAGDGLCASETIRGCLQVGVGVSGSRETCVKSVYFRKHPKTIPDRFLRIVGLAFQAARTGFSVRPS